MKWSIEKRGFGGCNVVEHNGVEYAFAKIKSDYQRDVYPVARYTNNPYPDEKENMDKAEKMILEGKAAPLRERGLHHPLNELR